MGCLPNAEDGMASEEQGRLPALPEGIGGAITG
jgi:hypothetical protein